MYVAATPFDPLLPKRTLDWAFALVGGLGIAAPVAALFFDVGHSWALLAIPAFVCTTITTLLAGRARTDASAVLGVFVGCVLPPALLLLPTGIGALIGALAGLLAAFALLPFVLVLRGAHAAPQDDDPEHVATFGAAWLVTVSVVMVLVASHHPSVAVLAALGVAAALALVVLVRDVARALFLDSVRAGRAPGFVLEDIFASAKLRVRGSAFSLLRKVTRTGDGPFRESETGASLGAVAVPRGRIVAAVALLWIAACGAALVLGA